MEKHIVIADVHVPYHLKTFIEIQLPMYISDVQPDTFIINGDFLDTASISSYTKGQILTTTLGEEYNQGNEILDLFDAVLPKKCKKVFLYGNHEIRFARSVLNNETAKLGSALINPTQGLRLIERGYEVIEDYPDGYYMLGDHLQVFHGVNTNKHCAQSNLEQFQSSCLTGHTHRTQIAQNDKFASYSIGCCADKNSIGFKYMPRNRRMNWTNAFATVATHEGFYHVSIHNIFKDQFFANGKLYKQELCQ